MLFGGIISFKKTEPEGYLYHGWCFDGDSWVVEHSRNYKPSHNIEHVRIILTCNIMRHFDWCGIDPPPSYSCIIECMSAALPQH